MNVSLFSGKIRIFSGLAHEWSLNINVFFLCNPFFMHSIVFSVFSDKEFIVGKRAAQCSILGSALLFLTLDKNECVIMCGNFILLRFLIQKRKQNNKQTNKNQFRQYSE